MPQAGVGQSSHASVPDLCVSGPGATGRRAFAPILGAEAGIDLSSAVEPPCRGRHRPVAAASPHVGAGGVATTYHAEDLVPSMVRERSVGGRGRGRRGGRL